MLITGQEKGTVNCRMQLKPRMPGENLNPKKLAASKRKFDKNIIDIKSTAEKDALIFSNNFAQSYPGSIHGLESVALVIQKNGSTTQDSSTFIISGADQVLILIDIAMTYDPDISEIENMKKSLSRLPTGYQNLLQRHAGIHGELFNRMRLDLGGGEDHKLTTEELLVKSTNDQLSNALIEKEFDAGRYNIISCTGELPPTLQGVWGGTYSPGWASDFTHNGNVPSAIASMLMGKMSYVMPKVRVRANIIVRNIILIIRVNLDTLVMILMIGRWRYLGFRAGIIEMSHATPQ